MNLAIDLDGVIAKLEHGRAKESPRIEWADDAEESITRLLLEGHRCVVHSCRSTWKEGGGWQAIALLLAQGGLRAYLDDGVVRHHGPIYPLATDFVFAEQAELIENAAGSKLEVGIWIGRGKPIAHHYIDDRGLTHLSWANTLAVLGLDVEGVVDPITQVILDIEAGELDSLGRVLARLKEVR